MKNSILAWEGDRSWGAEKKALWKEGINVVPKRGLGERKKLGTEAQQKTHAQ
jgi:hypothetical protein